MKTRLKHAVSILLALVPAVGLAQAQSPRARVMVLIDTSGSMASYFIDPTNLSTPPFGDYPGGDGSSFYTDQSMNNAFMYPGKRISGTCTQANTTGCEGLKSRLYAAKGALTKAVSGYGTIDFGLMSFDVQLCPFNSPLCQACALYDCTSGCVPCTNNCTNYTCLYANSAFNTLSSINWLPQSCSGPNGGGKIIVSTAAPISGVRILPWLDGVEDHHSSGDGDNSYGTGSTPINPELRAAGDSPLGESVNLARTGWYDVVKAADPVVNCRHYRLILITDSAESTSCAANPVTAAQALYNDNPTNHVLTHVISLAPATDPSTRTLHNNIAAAGGTAAAVFVTSAAELEAALGDIVNKIPLSDCSPACP